MKNMTEVLLSYLIAACNLVSCAAPEQVPEPKPPVFDVSPMVQELIADYGQNNGKETEKYTSLLGDIQKGDPEQGKIWEGIMQYWTYANDEMEIRTKKLPDDLPKEDTLCIIVLGFQLNADGSMQKELIGRLETALSCAKQYSNAYVLCTGGGTAARNHEATEAGMMGEWLVAHGLKKNRLIIEDASLTTAENAAFSYQILAEDYPQVDTAVIVTSDYHIPWGSVLFESEFRMHQSELHIVSDCAYKTSRGSLGKNELIRYELSGMQQLYALYLDEQKQTDPDNADDEKTPDSRADRPDSKK